MHIFFCFSGKIIVNVIFQNELYAEKTAITAFFTEREGKDAVVTTCFFRQCSAKLVDHLLFLFILHLYHALFLLSHHIIVDMI